MGMSALAPYLGYLLVSSGFVLGLFFNRCIQDLVLVTWQQLEHGIKEFLPRHMSSSLVYGLIVIKVFVYVEKITFYRPCVLMQRSEVISKWSYQLNAIILS